MADRPRSTRAAQCGLRWQCCAPTRGALLPTPSVAARPHQHRDGSAARVSKNCDRRARTPRRAARALLVLWNTGRPPTEHTCHAVRTWRGCVMGQRVARSSRCLRPGLDCTNIATGRRHGFRKVVVTVYGPGGAWPTRLGKTFYCRGLKSAAHSLLIVRRETRELPSSTPPSSLYAATDETPGSPALKHHQKRIPMKPGR